MRPWISRAAVVLASAIALSGCQGERPPIWDLYGDPAAQMPAVTGNAVIYDQTVTAYTWPDVGYWLGGPPRRPYYAPYPYPGGYWWYRNPAWGPPPMIRSNPAAPRAFGIRPAVPGPPATPPPPATPSLPTRTPPPLVAPPAAPPVVTPRLPASPAPAPAPVAPAVPAPPGR